MKKLLFTLIALLPTLVWAQGTKATRNLFDKKTVGEIRLTLVGKKWHESLDSLRIYGTGYLNGTAVIDGMKYENVGVRFRGDKSYQTGLKRNPFTIKLDANVADQNHQGYAAIKLSSALRDPSMVREALFYDIASQYLPASQTSYTKLYVNEDYIGVFVNVESIDKQFLTTHYGSSDGSFFKAGVDYKPATPADCKQGLFGALEYEANLDCYKGNFEMNSVSGWNDLQELTRLLKTDPAAASRMLDVDHVLWMHALNNVMVNLSSYTGNQSINYYLYKDPNGRFQPILWDLNLAFGSYKNTGRGSDLDLKGLQELDPLLHEGNEYKPLISQLLKDPLNRKIYLSHVRQINQDHFLSGSYEKRAQELQGSIMVQLNDDPNKYYSQDDYQRSLRETVGRKSKIPGIVELMSRRSKLLKGNAELSSLPSIVSEVKVQGRGKFENQPITDFRVTARADRFPKNMYIYYRLNAGDAFQVMPMTLEPSKDMPAGVKEFAVQIDGKGNREAQLEYYILAENAGSVTFEPRDYTLKTFKIKLSDLNK